ncbi:MAG: hypothetical protein ACT4QA_18345 [Panacagrimonas sp.]
MKYALLAVPQGETELQIVDVKDYDPAWVDALIANGNPKTEFIRPIEFLEKPTEPTGYRALSMLEIDANVVRQVWTLHPLPVPVITARQVRLALSQTGLRQAVEDIVAAASIDVRDYWEYSTELHREHPMLAAMAPTLGLSDAQIDSLFWHASTL